LIIWAQKIELEFSSVNGATIMPGIGIIIRAAEANLVTLGQTSFTLA